VSRAILVRGGDVLDLSSVTGTDRASGAYDINKLGAVCLDSGRILDSDSLRTRALGAPGYHRIIPYAINDDGEVAGLFHPDAGDSWFGHGFFCRNGQYHDLGNGAGVQSLNNVHTLVGCVPFGGSFSHPTPAIWKWDPADSEPQLTTPPLPLGWSKGVFAGVNDQGLMVGWAELDASSDSFAFFFDGSGYTDLNSMITDSEWVLTEAVSINNAGQIAGNGLLNNVETAFLLTPLPAPPRILDTELLLQFVQVSFGVKVGGSGWSSHGPVPAPGPLAAAQRDALLGLAIDAAASSLGDSLGQEIVRAAALEITRRAVDRLIRQAQRPAAPHLRSAGESQPGTVRDEGKLPPRRGRFPWGPRQRPKNAPNP